MGLNFRLVTETKKSVSMAFPFVGDVIRPINCSVLVVSGGKDVFVSTRDAGKIVKFHRADYLHLLEHDHDLLTALIAKEIQNWISVKK